MGSKIRVMVVDDEQMVREALSMVLDDDHRIAVVGQAADGAAALELARELRPEVVLLDVVMPGLDGLQVARVLRAEAPEARIVLLTSAEPDDRIIASLAEDVDCYMNKRVAAHDLARQVRRVAAGEICFDAEIMRRALKFSPREGGPADPEALSPREEEVLELMATPATYVEIGQQLGIAHETVRSHAKSVLRKLGRRNRGQAVIEAVRRGFIGLPVGD